MRREVSGGRGHGRGSPRVTWGGPGHKGEEPELSSEPSSEVGASGKAVLSEALPRRCLALAPWPIRF